MKENFELEEGEAHYCKVEEGDINPDTDFSYIVRVVLCVTFLSTEFCAPVHSSLSIFYL